MAIVLRRDVPQGVVGGPDVPDPLSVGRTKTLVHEAAHYVPDHAPGLPKGYVETVAESSAFVMMDRFDRSTGPPWSPTGTVVWRQR